MLERALSKKYRYKASKGLINTEDLYDLNLEQLNTMAKNYNRLVLQNEEEDYLVNRTKAKTLDEYKRDVILLVLKYKVKLQDEKSLREDKMARAYELRKVLKNKQQEKTATMTEEEILKELEALQ